MKAFLVTLFVLLFISGAQAQLAIGPEIGLNTATQKMEFSGTHFSNRSRVGLLAGLVINVGINKALDFQTGLSYLMKGCNFFAERNNQYYSSHILIHALQFPLYLNYQTSGTAYGRFVLGGGPCFGYNLAGKEYAASTSADLSIGSNKSDDIEPIDFALGLYLGYKVNNGLLFRAQYQLGVANLAPQPQGTIQSRCFAVSAVYLAAQKAKSNRKK